MAEEVKRSEALADQIHDACPHKINEPPNCALVKSRLECVCEHVHMHAIRAARPGASEVQSREAIISVIASDPDFGEVASRKDCERLADAIFALGAAQASTWPKEPPATGDNYTAGLWSRRNYAAMIEDFSRAQAAEPVPVYAGQPVPSAHRGGK